MGNPVFARAGAFQPQPTQQAYGQQYAAQGGYYQPGYGQPQPAPAGYGPQGFQQPEQARQERVMTFDDVVGKTGLVLLLIAAVGALTFIGVGDNIALIGGAAVLSSLVGFVTVLIVSTRAKVPAAGVIAYSVIEGVFLGAFSKLFEMLYPGIVVQAVVGTFCAAGVTLAAYKFFNIRVTPKFRKIVLISTIGFAAAMLLNLLASFLIPGGLGLATIGAGASWIAVLASGLGVVLAAMNLVVDFDYAEQGVRNRAPASESWRAAFGIAVTMVWLYTEILRILSYVREFTN